MADANETVSDIIAEMKREAAKIFPALPIAVLKLATCLEAAHDHDIAIATEASARAVVGACVKQQEAERKCVALREAMVEILEYIESFHKYITPDKTKGLTTLFAVADTIRDKARAALAAPATAEKSSAVGDAAKLREALERVLCWLKRMNAEPLNTLAVSELTPSYAVNKTAKSIIEDNDYHISQLTAALSAPPRNCDRFATLPDALAAWRDIDPREAGPFDTWLFALATEQEGGDK